MELEYYNPGTVPDPTTLRLRTKRTGGGSTTVMSYLLPSFSANGSEVATVEVDGEQAELEDWTPRS